MFKQNILTFFWILKLPHKAVQLEVNVKVIELIANSLLYRPSYSNDIVPVNQKRLFRVAGLHSHCKSHE